MSEGSKQEAPTLETGDSEVEISIPMLAEEDSDKAQESISEGTKSAYEDRAKRIIREFQSEHHVKWYDAIPDFEIFFKKMALPFSYSTRRVYQAAINHYLKVNRFDYKIMLDNLPPPTDDLFTDNRGRKFRDLRGKRVKHMPLELAMQLRREGFSYRKGVTSQFAGSIMYCSLFTGLRPVEWLNAELKGNVLVVKNAKFSKSRSFAETRKVILDMEKVPEKLIENIKWMIDVARRQNWNNLGFEEERDLMSRLAARARSLYDSINGSDKKKARYTLYSSRHQFCANAKAAGATKVEIAALMGHRSIETAGEHYARKKVGRAGEFCVKPDQTSVALVEKFNQKGPSSHSVPDFVL